jgi:hypothetical protein
MVKLDSMSYWSICAADEYIFVSIQTNMVSTQHLQTLSLQLA